MSLSYIFCQEELRCRQLELEVEGLSSKVAAAEGHRRRLEAMLKETKRERDALKVRCTTVVGRMCFILAFPNATRKNKPNQSLFTNS